MGSVNWKQKLSSRKLWVSVAGWLGSILTAFNVTENVVAQVGIIVSGIGALCVYILSETAVDKARAATESKDGGGTQ
jgi:hypothetical protein